MVVPLSKSSVVVGAKSLRWEASIRLWFLFTRMVHVTTGLPHGPGKRENKEECCAWRVLECNAITIKGFGGAMQVKLARGAGTGQGSGLGRQGSERRFGPIPDNEKGRRGDGDYLRSGSGGGELGSGRHSECGARTPGGGGSWRSGCSTTRTGWRWTGAPSPFTPWPARYAGAHRPERGGQSRHPAGGSASLLPDPAMVASSRSFMAPATPPTPSPTWATPASTGWSGGISGASSAAGGVGPGAG